MKCLEKDRRRRYETANGLANDIQRHLGSEPIAARPPSKLYRFEKLVRRNKGVFTAAGAVVAALILALAATTRLYMAERKAKAEQAKLWAQAQTEAAKSQQVAGFLKNMLKGVGPSVALGRDTALLKEILDKTSEQVSKDLKGQPEVEAELGSIIGRTYTDISEYPKAEAMQREALRLGKARFGETNGFVAGVFCDLAGTLDERGQIAEAESKAREALAILGGSLATSTWPSPAHFRGWPLC